jgi:hypothetical protein
MTPLTVTWSIVQLGPAAVVDPDGTVRADVARSNFTLVARAADGRATSVRVLTDD